MAQTAVSWLNEKIELDMSVMEILGLIRQAKQMEKEQIINAWESGNYFAYYFSSINIENGEQYYNETFTSTPLTENPSATENEQ